LSPLDFRAGSKYQANLRQWQFAEKDLPNSVVNISELLANVESFASKPQIKLLDTVKIFSAICI